MKYFSIRRLPFLLSLAAAVFLAPTLATAQKDKDWRPISPEDIAAKTPVVEPDADAEALLWEVRIDDSDMTDLSMKHYVRVKVFTERGREQYSKFDIPFLKDQKIKDLAARVIRPDGSVVEVGKDDIFEREIVKANGVKLKAKSFAVPNIEPGVIVEYRYKEVYTDAGAYGRRLELQRDIPVRNMAYYYKPYEGEPRYKVFNNAEAKFIKDKGGYYVITRSNVPAFKQESYMPPDDNVRPWIRLGWTGFTWLGLLDRAGAFLALKSGSGDLKKLAAQLVEGASSDEEKLQKLYDYCQTQISNTTFDTTLTDEMRQKLPKIEAVKDIVKRKQASSGLVNLLFGSLAMSQGFDARPAYIGDRSKMFTNPQHIDESFLALEAVGIRVNGRCGISRPEIVFCLPGTSHGCRRAARSRWWARRSTN